MSECLVNNSHNLPLQTPPLQSYINQDAASIMDISGNNLYAANACHIDSRK